MRMRISPVQVLLISLVVLCHTASAVLLECPECRNEVSSTATACPKCGYRIPRQTSTTVRPSSVPVPQITFDEQQISAAMAIIQSDTGAGSGFFCRINGKTYLISNQHVWLGNVVQKIKDMKNRDLHVKTMEFHKELDLVKISVEESDIVGLSPATEQPRIGQNVYVFGNSQGAGVVTRLTGAILGVGPEKLETDAQFVPGNSGSPILSGAGTVLGVATYMSLLAHPEDWTVKGTRFTEPRRFGLRLTDNAVWVSVSSDEYRDYVLILSGVWAFITDYYLLFTASEDTLAGTPLAGVVADKGGLDKLRNDYSFAGESNRYQQCSILCRALEGQLIKQRKYRESLKVQYAGSQGMQQSSLRALKDYQREIAGLPKATLAKVPRKTKFMQDTLAVYDEYAKWFEQNSTNIMISAARPVTIDSRNENGTTIADSVSKGSKIILRYRNGSWRTALSAPSFSPDRSPNEYALSIYAMVKVKSKKDTKEVMQRIAIVGQNTRLEPFVHTVAENTGRVMLRINDFMGTCGDNEGSATYDYEILPP